MQQHHLRNAPERKRKSVSKRKSSDQGDHYPGLVNQQATISDIFSKNTSRAGVYGRSSSPSNKRPRLSPSSSPTRPHELISPDKMYNFANSRHGEQSTSSGSGSGSGPIKPAFSNAAPRQSNFTPHAGAKRLVVKNLRTGPKLNQDSYFEKVWGQLDAALVAIFDGGKPDTSLEELYKGAENVCRQGRAEVLARKLQEKCREHVSGRLRQNLVSRAAGTSDIDALRVVVDAWAVWQSKLVCVVAVMVSCMRRWVLM